MQLAMQVVEAYELKGSPLGKGVNALRLKSFTPPPESKCFSKSGANSFRWLISCWFLLTMQKEDPYL